MPADRGPDGVVRRLDDPTAPPATGGGPSTALRRATPQEVRLPCPRCVHTAICAIREALDATPIDLRVPALPDRARDAITVRAVVEVECSFFRRAPGVGGGAGTMSAATREKMRQSALAREAAKRAASA